MVINKESINIRIDGYKGTWYVIDSMLFQPVKKDENITLELFLLESEQYGEEWASLIVTKYGMVVCDTVYNGFDDLDD